MSEELNQNQSKEVKDTAVKQENEVKEENKSSKASSIDSDKIASELQKMKNRISREQREKIAANDKVKELQAELDKYKKEQASKKDPENTEEHKMLEELKKANEELKGKLIRNDRLNEVNSIFKKSGLNISDSILNMIVTDPNDGDSINANTQAIVDLIRQVQSDSKKELLKGTTPKANTKSEVNSVAKALGL